MSDKSAAFISYHHSDKVVGEAIYEQLTILAQKGRGRDALTCFLDVRDIRAGVPWQPVIDKALNEKDWLMVVFTGEQSMYCGYEIGTFTQIHSEDFSGDNPTKRIVCLYDVEADAVPVVLRASQNISIPPVDRAVDPKDVKILTEEAAYWYHSPIGQLLFDFCNYKCLYTTADEKDDPGAYSDNIALAAKCISNAFARAKANDVKEETSCQIGFEINIPGGSSESARAIPSGAVVVGNTLAFAMIGLNIPMANHSAPTLTWGRLKELLGLGRGDVPWLHKVEADILLAIDSLAISNDDITFRGRTGKIFRPILSRHQLLVNGDRKFYILLVETLDRRFAGSPNSSLMLTAIILASRWRFTYFERWAETIDRTFGADVSLQDFSDGCRQLIYNIEWIEHESAELGANDMRALIDAFGIERRARVERFFSDWDAAKALLMKSLPSLGTEIVQSNRNSIRDGIISFLTSTRSQNSDFLELAVKTYSEMLSAELGRDRRFVESHSSSAQLSEDRLQKASG